MPKLSFIGDLTVDIYPKLNKTRLGGSSLTCALWAKKLGAKPTILAAVGEDGVGRQYQELFKKENFSLKFLKTFTPRSSTPRDEVGPKSHTSQIEIFLDKNGERTWGKWDVGALKDYHLGKPEFDFLKTQDAVAMPVYAKTKHLLSELLSFRLSQNPQIPQIPLIVIDFDDLSQFDKSTKIIEDHLPYIDIVMCGLDIVSDAKIIRKLQNLASNKLFVVTLNKNGSIAFLGDKVFRQKADKIKVINSTGAGDAFLSGFLVEYVKSKNIKKSLKEGTKIASRAIAQIGAY